MENLIFMQCKAPDPTTLELDFKCQLLTSFLEVLLKKNVISNYSQLLMYPSFWIYGLAAGELSFAMFGTTSYDF